MTFFFWDRGSTTYNLHVVIQARDSYDPGSLYALHNPDGIIITNACKRVLNTSMRW